MSEKLTRIRVPGLKGLGLLEWGEKTAAEMISTARRHAAHLRSQAEAIEATADGGFQIDLVRGSHVQHHIKEIQKGQSDVSEN